MADRRRLDALGRAQHAELIPVLRRHGQHHSLLSFRDPNLGVVQPRVLQRCILEPDFGPGLFAHFADRATEAAGSAVGDRAVETEVASLQDHIHDHLLGHRVSDLHRTAGQGLALLSQFR